MIESQFEKMLDNMNVDDIVVLKGMFNFQGNVVSVDKENGFFEFYVTHADDEDVIGDTIINLPDFNKYKKNTIINDLYNGVEYMIEEYSKY
jgi:hypothetical protein